MRSTRLLARTALAPLAALALLATACGGLGPDELPDEVGSGEREEIQETIEAFLFGVNEYNPQVASEVMLIPAELGIHEVERMVLHISALEAEAVTVEFLTLGPTQLDTEHGVVNVQVTTNIGPIDADLVRRDGEWRFASVPDLLPSPGFGNHHLEWEVTNSYPSPDGSFLTVVGRIDNVGEGPVLQLGTPGYFLEDAGATVVVAQSVVTVKPFVHPGEHTYFRLDFPVPDGQSLDVDRFVLVPTFRLSHPDDEDALASLVPSSDDASFDQLPDSLDVLNGELIEARAQLVALVFDANGRLLSVYGTAELTIGAAQRVSIPLPEVEAAPAAEASRLVFEVWGTAQRN